jgi:hypothetical protein
MREVVGAALLLPVSLLSNSYEVLAKKPKSIIEDLKDLIVK